jgi:hemin uptake protein HemP
MNDEKPAVPTEAAKRGDPLPSPIASAPRISSADLFRGGREIEIDHNGRRYQLRITQTGKLILTA